MDIKIEPFHADQMQIKAYGRRVGYCGSKPGMPVTFLTSSRGQCRLTKEERADVIQHVIDFHGGGPEAVRITPQMSKVMEHGGKREDVDEVGDFVSG